jgi:hypothetical protein
LICGNPIFPIFLHAKGSKDLKTFGRRFTQKRRIKPNGKEQANPKSIFTGMARIHRIKGGA